MSELLTKIEEIVTPVLSPEGVEVVDLTYQKEHGGWTLRFYLDKSGGFSLDDCAQWSERIGSLLDAADVISHAYVLEVSSPGIERPLKKLEDFRKFIGQRASVKLFAPIDGQKNFHGVLTGCSEQTVELDLEDTRRRVSLPRTQIAKANLKPDIKI